MTNRCLAPIAALAISLVVVAVVMSITTDAAAATITYNITQGGWTGGGTIEGIFTGEDLNHDGFIDRTSGEVADYRVTFSGNATILSFTHFLGSLQFLRYTIGSFGFPPSAPLFSSGGGVFYDGDDGVISFSDGSRVTSTELAARVSRAPEPATAAMMAAGMAWLAGALRARGRRRS